MGCVRRAYFFPFSFFFVIVLTSMAILCHNKSSTQGNPIPSYKTREKRQRMRVRDSEASSTDRQTVYYYYLLLMVKK